MQENLLKEQSQKGCSIVNATTGVMETTEGKYVIWGRQPYALKTVKALWTIKAMENTMQNFDGLVDNRRMLC